MRIFFDSNVWIASLLTPRACRELTQHCWSEHNVLISEWVFQELHKVLRKKFKFPEKSFEVSLELIRRNSFLVKEVPLKKRVCEDPDDDHILAGALGGEAHCLITGDRDLLSLEAFAKIPILSPSAFWKFEQDFEQGR